MTGYDYGNGYGYGNGNGNGNGAYSNLALLGRSKDAAYRYP